MRLKAYAKINLFLKVKGVLDNGYHDLEMVNVPIDLFDSIHVQEGAETIITCDKGYIPTDQRNTIRKVLDILHEEKSLPPQKIHLVKNIPSLAGLAGGSADAATLINYFNEHYGYGLSQDELIELGLRVGADVPFCIVNTCSKVEGIGEKVTPIPRKLHFYLFLIKPRFGISTKELFDQPIETANPKASIDQMIHALAKDDYEMFIKNMTNDLQKAAIQKHPKIQHMIDDLLGFGFDHAMMSGSGSVVYGVTQDDDLADKAVIEYFKKYPFVKKSRIFG